MNMKQRKLLNLQKRRRKLRLKKLSLKLKELPSKFLKLLQLPNQIHLRPITSKVGILEHLTMLPELQPIRLFQPKIKMKTPKLPKTRRLLILLPLNLQKSQTLTTEPEKAHPLTTGMSTGSPMSSHNQLQTIIVLLTN